jgi:hypothetical protein
MKDLIPEHTTIATNVITSKDGQLLGIWRIKKYNQGITVCKVRCKLGHTWETYVDRLKQGYWCAECYAISQRIPEAEVKQLVEARDGTILSDVVKDGKRLVTIRCNIDGNVWAIKPTVLKQKHSWCRECFKRNKIKPVDIASVIETVTSNGFELLTTGPLSFWSEIEIRCQKHNLQWVTKYGTLVRGDSNCKLCAWGIESYDTVKNKAAERGYEIKQWMMKGGSHLRTQLHCPKHSYTWNTSHNYILKDDRICYYCAREERKTSYKTIKALVESNNGTLLTENCVGSTTKIKIRCNKDGHEWETSYDSISSGEHWCPKCPWPKQSKVFDIVKELLPNHNIVWNAKPFEWLKDKSRLELDIWVPSLKLAIEYDGEQHFEEVRRSASQTKRDIKKALASLQKRDQIKDTLISQHPEDIKHFIRIKYDEPLTSEHVLERLKQAGIQVDKA